MAASQPLRLPAAAGRLVLAGGGFMPARLLLVPVGVRLPPGVHAVVATAGSGSRASVINSLLPRAAVLAPVGARLPPDMLAVAAVPATTAVVVAPAGGGSGSRGRATHLLPRAAASESGEPAAEADDGEARLKEVLVFYDFITTQALDALWVVDDFVPPTTTKAEKVKEDFKRAVALAGQGTDKMDCALEIMRGWYGVVDLTYTAYPSPLLSQLPGEQAFLDMCLAAGEHSPPVILGLAVTPLVAHFQVPNGEDADLVRSLFVAVAVCQAAARAARASYTTSGNPNPN